MKKILLVSAALLSAHVAFPQGQVTFDNRQPGAGTVGTFPGTVTAPFYNQDPSCPTCVKQGNTSAGLPAGNQTYSGSVLFNDANHSYTATLWAINTATFTGSRADDKNNLELVGTTTMRTSTSGTSAGRVAALANPVPVPNVGASDRATFQVRVWDSRGGTITTWAQVLADNTIPRGFSTVFDLPYQLGGFGQPPGPAPNLEGLTSFQLFIVGIPEPSVIALGVLGAGCLFLLRRRK